MWRASPTNPGPSSATTSAASPTPSTSRSQPPPGRLSSRPTSADFLVDQARKAEALGIPPERIVIDAGLDLGKTWEQSLTLLRASNQLAALGYPLLLSASNKTFLGRFLELEIDQRGPASLGAAALGVARGCRIIRAHDVKGTRRVCDTLAAVLEAV